MSEESLIVTVLLNTGHEIVGKLHVKVEAPWDFAIENPLHILAKKDGNMDILPFMPSANATVFPYRYDSVVCGPVASAPEVANIWRQATGGEEPQIATPDKKIIMP